jgi:hypothetical protein
MSEVKHCYVSVNGVYKLFKHKPVIPRVVCVIGDDESRDFHVKPFITYSELSTYRKRRVRPNSSDFSFDERSPYALTEEEFQKEFCEYVKDYQVLVMDYYLNVTYFESFVKDKKVMLRQEFHRNYKQ